MLRRTLGELLDLLLVRADDDWRVPAGTLRWDVVDTVDHLTDVCTWFSVQLAAAASAPTRLYAKPPAATGNIERVRTLAAAGALLDTVLAAVPSTRRAWHPMGSGDATDFRTMASAELLVHGHDIAAGLGLDWCPDDTTATCILSRLFPTVAIDTDPWQLLLWAHGRLPLDDRPQRTAWTWAIGS